MWSVLPKHVQGQLHRSGAVIDADYVKAQIDELDRIQREQTPAPEGTPGVDETTQKPAIPTWALVAGGALLLVVLVK